MLIGGFVPFSLIDFPPHMTCVVFTQGCNFRCPYCHNPELVTSGAGGHRFMLKPFFDFLEERKGKLDAVVITGGEPGLQENLAEFIGAIKALGYLVKLDTNGTSPGLLADLLRRGLLDAVAMDIKAPFARYPEVAGKECDEELVTRVRESVRLLLAADIEYEFRTTVVKGLLAPADILSIGESIKGARRYALQRFAPSRTFDPAFADAVSLSDDELERLKQELTACRIGDIVLR
jgi:pyruvate formate lyase activating enzyme